jgi:hypothetical protein
METIRARSEIVGALPHLAHKFDMLGPTSQKQPCKYYLRGYVCQRTETILGPD